MNAEDFQVLVLTGSPRERGRAHGEALRAQIQAMVGEWKENIAKDLGQDPEEFLRQLV